MSAKAQVAVMPSQRRIVRKPDPKPTKEPEPCIKCRLNPGSASFGVCPACYRDLPQRVRERLDRLEQSPSSPQWAESSPGALPQRAVDDDPGSFEKLLTLAERIRKGLDPWHPYDAGSEPAELESTVNESFLKTDVGGVHWCNWNGGYRAYPWFTIGPFKYKRYHLGYFEDQCHAIRAVWDWRKRANEIGPRQAMFEIRKKWEWATRLRQKNAV